MLKLTVNWKKLSVFGTALVVATISLYGCGGSDLQGSEDGANPDTVADQTSFESTASLEATVGEAAASDPSKSTDNEDASARPCDCSWLGRVLGFCPPSCLCGAIACR
jgi:hypothetical protein